MVNSGGIQLYNCDDPEFFRVLINSTGFTGAYNRHNNDNNNIKAKVRFCFERGHNIEL